MGDDQRPGRVAVAGLEGADDVHVVLRAQRVAPRRVAQHLTHAALDAERLIRLQQVVVAGQGEQVVVERRVGLGVLRGVDEVVVLDVGHRRLGQQPVTRQLLSGQASQRQLQRAEFQRLPCLEQRVGGVDLGMFLADLVAVLATTGSTSAGVAAATVSRLANTTWPARCLAPLGIRAPSSASRPAVSPVAVAGAMSWPAMDRIGPTVVDPSPRSRTCAVMSTAAAATWPAIPRASLGDQQRLLRRCGRGRGRCARSRCGAAVGQRELLVVEAGRLDAGFGDVGAHRLDHRWRAAEVHRDVAVVEVRRLDQAR